MHIPKMIKTTSTVRSRFLPNTDVQIRTGRAFTMSVQSVGVLRLFSMTVSLICTYSYTRFFSLALVQRMTSFSAHCYNIVSQTLKKKPFRSNLL